jgi:hypothetical protein
MEIFRAGESVPPGSGLARCHHDPSISPEGAMGAVRSQGCKTRSGRMAANAQARRADLLEPIDGAISGYARKRKSRVSQPSSQSSQRKLSHLRKWISALLQRGHCRPVMIRLRVTMSKGVCLMMTCSPVSGFIAGYPKSRGEFARFPKYPTQCRLRPWCCGASRVSGGCDPHPAEVQGSRSASRSSNSARTRRLPEPG